MPSRLGFRRPPRINIETLLRRRCRLIKMLDLPGVEFSRGYIQNWWGTGNPIPERSAQRILKAADQILKAGAVVKAAIYARVSTVDQEPENQLQELRRYVAACGWTAVEYVDRAVSGAKDRR